MADETRPLVPPEESPAELTLKALLLGVVLAGLLGAANAYLGFKAGQTVSATFPAAVLAIAAFRLPFFRGTVLEQNTMRTAASVGEALVAGAIFTVPAFVMVNVGGQRLWTSFSYWETSIILLVGGLLGILFVILLRRTLTVDAGLPFPESRACAEIVKAAQGGDTGARYVFGAMGLGMLIQVFKDGAGIRMFQETVEVVKSFPASVVHHFDSSRAPLADVTHRGALVWSTPSISPALIGVGYVIGFELSAINFAGGVLAWFVLVPLALFLNPGFGESLARGGGRRLSRSRSSRSGTTRSARSPSALCS
jgi:putative OPT family oligopeptide transporter